MNLLSLTNVSAGYGRSRVLHGVCLDVAAHERVAILGRNGVGKTTIVNTMLGIATLHSGQVVLRGKTHAKLRHFHAARSGIAVVPQGRRIVPGLTVRENLLLGAAVNRKGPWTMERVFDMYPILRERADTAGTAMSGGQQQMLAIGRGLMSNPDLLVLDEPSEGLAPVVVDELGVSLARLAETGTSVLLIEQNYGLIQRVAQSYCILSKGAVVETGQLAGLSIEALKRHVTV
jgi:branched-chain amino acid transport system ATP-binding protein